jgi:hypothetical protein
MILLRDTFADDGIFGVLVTDDHQPMAETLEHAYLCADGVYRPKVPPGTYECRRGVHQLSGRLPFETFEVTGVEGHSGILFHPGNRNGDSSGCILLGVSRSEGCINNSREAFEKFMDSLNSVNTFTLLVTEGV